jgi:hypothetical protein
MEKEEEDKDQFFSSFSIFLILEEVGFLFLFLLFFLIQEKFKKNPFSLFLWVTLPYFSSFSFF